MESNTVEVNSEDLHRLIGIAEVSATEVLTLKAEVEKLKNEVDFYKKVNESREKVDIKDVLSRIEKSKKIRYESLDLDNN